MYSRRLSKSAASLTDMNMNRFHNTRKCMLSFPPYIPSPYKPLCWHIRRHKRLYCWLLYMYNRYTSSWWSLIYRLNSCLSWLYPYRCIHMFCKHWCCCRSRMYSFQPLHHCCCMYFRCKYMSFSTCFRRCSNNNPYRSVNLPYKLHKNPRCNTVCYRNMHL